MLLYIFIYFYVYYITMINYFMLYPYFAIVLHLDTAVLCECEMSLRGWGVDHLSAGSHGTEAAEEGEGEGDHVIKQ